MLKKLSTGLLTAALLTFTNATAFANANYVSPYATLPGNLDIVMEVSLKELPGLQPMFKELIGDESESFRVFMDAVLNNPLVFGAEIPSSGLADVEDIINDSEEVYFAVRMSAQKYKRLKGLLEKEEGEMTQEGNILPFYCNGGCLGHFGGYLYITEKPHSMEKVARNFYKGERDTLAQNQSFLESQDAALKNSALDIYVDFEELLGGLINEVENELYFQGGDSIASLLVNTLRAVEFQGVSAEMSNSSVGLRTYVKYNADLLKKLPFNYLESVFQPGLHTYFDGNHVIGYVEGFNLGGQSTIIFGLIEEGLAAQEAYMSEWMDPEYEFYDEEYALEYENELKKQREVLKHAKKLTQLLSRKYAMHLGTPKEGTLPTVTFLGEVSRNRTMRAKQSVDKIAEIIEAAIDEENKWEKEWAADFGEEPLLTEMKQVEDGLYEIHIPFDEWDQESFQTDGMTITFGINTNNMLVISNSGTYETRVVGQDNNFTNEVANSGKMLGIGYFNFKTLHTYLASMEDEMFAEDIAMLGYFKTLTMRSYFRGNAVRTDFNLGYEQAGYQLLLDTLKNEL